MKLHDKRPIILIVTHVIPLPPSAGNEIRILNLANWLKLKGFKVILLLEATELNPVVRESLSEIFNGVFLSGRNKISRFIDRISLQKSSRSAPLPASAKKALAPPDLIRMTKRLCKKYRPAAVIAEYIFTAPCLDVVPHGILKVIDTHDMFSRKRDQVVSFGIDDPFCCNPAEERDYLLKGDLVIAIQPNEAALFKKLVPEKHVIDVGIDFDVVPEIDDGQVDAGSILVVGSDNPLNIHGLNEFIRNSWPAVRGRFPDAILRVIGKVGNHLFTNEISIKKIGWVADLDCEYKKAAIVINPTVAGTGLKIKTVEALCHAKAFVGSPNSVDGIIYEGESPFVVGENWDDFSTKILWLLEDVVARRKLQEKAWRYAKENFHSEKVYAPLAKALKTHLGNSSASSGLNL